MSVADVLLYLYILLVIAFWCIIPGFFVWGVAVAIKSFSPERQAQKATPVHLLKADAKRILAVLSIAATILAAVIILLIYSILDLSEWLARQWRKTF
jgi:integrase